MKSEPDVYGIEDLQRDGQTFWGGVRNYQARNFMTNDMAVGSQVLFYHSNAEPPGVAGLMKVVSEAQADPTALDANSEYFEPKATPENPIWKCVTVKFVEKFPRLVSLEEIRKNPKLKDMALLQKGSRLSIQPVTDSEFGEILKMARG